MASVAQITNIKNRSLPYVLPEDGPLFSARYISTQVSTLYALHVNKLSVEVTAIKIPRNPNATDQCRWRKHFLVFSEYFLWCHKCTRTETTVFGLVKILKCR